MRALEGVGLGWRRPLAHDLLRAPDVVDFVEVIADNVVARPDLRRELAALSRVWPVVPHGVKLSLGSVAGFDVHVAKAYGKLARELGAPFVSEHISFVRAGAIEIGHLTQLPRTREAALVVAKNARAAMKAMKTRLVLENVAWSVQTPDDELDEPAFVRMVLDESGCELLLDVANLYANAKNEGVDPVARVDAYPLDRVAMIHVAGSEVREGFVFDTHAHAVPDDVLALLAHVYARVGPKPTLLERDRGFDFVDHTRELAKLRTLQRSAPPVLAPPSRAPTPRSSAPIATTSLALTQRRLASALTGGDDDGFDQAQLRRARGILARKRAEEHP